MNCKADEYWDEEIQLCMPKEYIDFENSNSNNNTAPKKDDVLTKISSWFGVANQGAVLAQNLGIIRNNQQNQFGQDWQQQQAYYEQQRLIAQQQQQQQNRGNNTIWIVLAVVLVLVIFLVLIFKKPKTA
jgi:hypothetical protein